MKLEIETYEENGTKMVWIGEENGSGSKYPYITMEDLMVMINSVVLNAIAEEEE